MTGNERRAAVIGLGNPMRRDDGVGPTVVDELDDGSPTDADLIVLDGESTRLIEAWRDRPMVVVVDAVTTGSTAGTVHEVTAGADPLPNWGAGASTHRVGIAEAIALAEALGRLPETLVVVGVEPADMSDGPGLSPEVAAVVPAVAQIVRDRLRR